MPPRTTRVTLRRAGLMRFIELREGDARRLDSPAGLPRGAHLSKQAWIGPTGDSLPFAV
jgi:hypothetical protein